MNKLKLLMLLLLAVGFETSAQFVNPGGGNSHQSAGSEISVKYQGDMGVGVFADDATVMTIGTTHGAKISDYFFAGIGVWGEVNTDDWGWWNIAPMLSLKGYYPLNDGIRLFVNPEFGVTIGVAGEVESGFYSYKNEGSHSEYRLTGGIEMDSFFFGIGCGGAGSTSFFAKLGILF